MSLSRGLKGKRKLQEIRKHRETCYLEAIGKVIDGTASPNYATYRWKKLKGVR